MARSSRLLAATSVVVGAALALTACSSSSDDSGGDTGAAGPVTLEFWGWATGLEDAVALWNEENPDIQVDFFRMTGDDGDKIPAAIDNGTAPDVVQMSVHSIPSHVIANRLTDLTEYVGDLEDDFTEASWANVTFDGSTYAVPQDFGPNALMYRSDIFEQHGLTVPTTWDEYLETARALKAADPDLYIAQMSPNETGYWIADVWQNEGSWFGIDGDAWTVDVNDEASKEVAERWQTLLDEDLVKVVDMWTPEYWAEINAGTIATINYAAWFPAMLEANAADLAGSWSVAPSPVSEAGSTAAGAGDSSVDVIPTGTEDVAQAAQFLTWLNTSDESLDILVGENSMFPAALSGLQSDALHQPNEYFGGQVVNDVFAEAAENVPASWVDGPVYDLVQDNIKDQFAKVGNGAQTFEQALDAAAEYARTQLEQQGLNVK
ncbi:ABC transporter substrate-binding protein [Cellulomonas sp. P4]|uniref:ABC transporter substrate-binding protein n=1 Tax=Cellulomonas sp. P4 TaxID=3142533 RepID=UPI0031BB8981